ncbi:hypothetical protein V1514DRAFT_318167 [Lipomyces japonicus]|uniref:uncharacterized protein n=1 Tax=Lipomyces japonicus TaxID=56871 RepID=UPI0034CEE824
MSYYQNNQGPQYPPQSYGGNYGPPQGHPNGNYGPPGGYAPQYQQQPYYPQQAPPVIIQQQPARQDDGMCWLSARLITLSLAPVLNVAAIAF